MLNIEEWRLASNNDRIAFCREISSSQTYFTFLELREFELSGESNVIGVFRFECTEFAFVPGCSAATLGFDRTRPVILNTEEQDSWNEFAGEFGISLDEYLDHSLTPLRTSIVAPMLAQMMPTQLHTTTKDLFSMIHRSFRFPTTDEWEYLCAGGSRTLFRWGTGYPVDPETGVWDMHLRPNAFGMNFHDDPYASEICEHSKCRGGDGGESSCGGYGDYPSMIPYASSYRMEDDRWEPVPDSVSSQYRTYFRLVWPLDEDARRNQTLH